MDHQPLMRVLHGRAHLEKQLQPLSGRKAVVVTIRIDPYALDQLHHQVGNAVVSGAAIQQTGDVGMIERGENLALSAEAFQNKRGIEAAAHQFHGDFLGVLAIRPGGAVHLTHAAMADRLSDLIDANAAASAGHGGRWRCCLQIGSRSVQESCARLFV